MGGSAEESLDWDGRHALEIRPHRRQQARDTSATGDVLTEAIERPKRLYLPQLDAMRFAAFLAVFSLHGLPSVDPRTHAAGAGHVLAVTESVMQHAGSDGVGLFFLLSAFLITELLRRERETTGAIHLKKFYVRRLLRIWPLYFLVLLIGLLLQPLAGNFHLPAVTVASAFLFLMNWDVAFHGFHWNPIFVLWTISSEEQFYAVWPVMMKALLRRPMMWVCLAQMSVAMVVAFWPGGWFVARQTTEVVASLTYFPLGGLLAMSVGSVREIKPTQWCVGMVAAGLCGWFFGGLLGVRPEWVGGSEAGSLALGKGIVLAGTVLIFVGFLRSDPERWPAWSVYLGKISYGLYVFHVMVLDLVLAGMNRLGLTLRAGAGHSGANLLLVFGVKLPAAMLLTICVAAISYRWFETPFLRIKDRYALVHSRAV